MLRRAAIVALTAMLSGAALVGAGPTRQVTVGTAEAELGTAEDAYAEATDRLHDALEVQRALGAQAAALEVELRELDAEARATVLAFEATLSRARDLAVNAYVRGGTQADLDNYLDAEAATELVLKLHLTRGRVDDAQAAASELRTERIAVNARVSDVATEIAALNAQLDDADAAVRDAHQVEQQAYAALLEAGAALDEARAAEAEAVAAAQRRADADAEAARRAGAASAGGTTSDTTDGRTDTEAAAEADTAAAVVPTPFVPPAPPSADQADGWARLRDCESGGDYSAIGGGGQYRGAYQFAQSTWESVGGVGDPAAAPPAEQDYRARLLYERSGAGQWPLCGRYLR